MIKDFIDYGALIDEAMHIIVKRSLQIASSGSLPGVHHFFISFITNFPGVCISEKLKNRYPNEMTIVLQYQFEDLLVEDNQFSVILSFDNLKEKIVIPYAAITSFADPSVKFGLQFRHIDSNDYNANNAQPKRSNTSNKKDNQNILKDSNTSNVVTLDSFRKNKE